MLSPVGADEVCLAGGKVASVVGRRVVQRGGSGIIDFFLHRTVRCGNSAMGGGGGCIDFIYNMHALDGYRIELLYAIVF